jgi:hypothetical protein
MTPEQQRIAIAEACGWKETEAWLDGRRCFERADINAGWDFDSLPDYLNDLNAMHDAEKVLGILERGTYQNILGLACGGIREDDGGHFVSHRESIHATAAQRAEAFLRTIGKWRGAK